MYILYELLNIQRGCLTRKSLTFCDSLGIILFFSSMRLQDRLPDLEGKGITMFQNVGNHLRTRRNIPEDLNR
jgi:hypothetical protein